MIGRTISHYEIIEQLGEGGRTYAKVSLDRLVPAKPISLISEISK